MQTYTYIAKKLDEIHYTPGAWTGNKVGVFRVEGEKEEQIGEYERNYPALFRTFYHFKKNEKDYALYSPHYTVTRIMELPSCRDIGGEERNSYGFCPTDYYVPTHMMMGYQNGSRQYLVNEPDKTKFELLRDPNSKPATPILHYPFGFVAGCIWGDDSSWKIQYLDLSEAEKGILRREEKFGYIKLPDTLTLKQAINIKDYSHDPDEDYSYQIAIAIEKTFDLRDGRMVDANEDGMYGDDDNSTT